MEAELHLYPSTFEEMFCISVAESQVAGVFPITSTSGALPTTNMGKTLFGNPDDNSWRYFCENSSRTPSDPELSKKQEWLKECAKKRFSIENILNQWEEKIFS